jgi:hypothetical protein
LRGAHWVAILQYAAVRPLGALFWGTGSHGKPVRTQRPVIIRPAISPATAEAHTALPAKTSPGLKFFVNSARDYRIFLPSRSGATL